MDNTIQVNALPVRTYRWLNMNKGALEVDDNARFTRIAPQETLPKGVAVSRAQDASCIDALFKNAQKEMEARDKNAVLPNGDVIVGHTGQAIPTGMGAEVDRLMTDASVAVDVYEVPEGATLDEPLSLRFTPEENGRALSRQVFHIGKNATATILMDYYALKKTTGFLGVQTYLLAEEGAKVKLVKVQMLGEDFTHFDDFGGVAMDGAQVEMARLELGSAQSWNGAVCNLLGDDASYASETGYLCRRAQRYDYNHVAIHRGKHTAGRMRFHGVLLDKAHKTLRGTIDFRAGAQGADGEESEEALLLSPEAVNRTIPIILCQEEDINGHHGATIGQLGDEMLFYMQSRGFSEAEAKKLVIRAKIMRVANLIPEGDLKSHVNAYLCDTL